MDSKQQIKIRKQLGPIFYGLLVGITFMQWLYFKDLTNAAIAFNLALAFDPFNQNQKWVDRPLWQRAWLVVHVTIGIGLIVGLAIIKVLGK